MSDRLPLPAARCRRSGLTVLELVSALALFVIVLGTLMIALNSATDIWARNTSKTRATQKARQALDRLATDLASAVAQSTVSHESSAPTASEEPFFIAENRNDKQIALYFVRQLSPAEVSGDGAISLEAVSYSWTTNGLSRYVRPLATSLEGVIEPPVSDQLVKFKRDVENITVVSNLLAASIVQFMPLVYQPLSSKVTTPETQPLEPLNKEVSKIELADLPDFIDVILASVEPQDSSASGTTNYLTRRITLPAAQASRLP